MCMLHINGEKVSIPVTSPPAPAFPFSVSVPSTAPARLTGQGEIAALEGMEFRRTRFDAHFLGDSAPSLALVALICP